MLLFIFSCRCSQVYQFCWFPSSWFDSIGWLYLPACFHSTSLTCFFSLHCESLFAFSALAAAALSLIDQGARRTWSMTPRFSCSCLPSGMVVVGLPFKVQSVLLALLWLLFGLLQPESTSRAPASSGVTVLFCQAVLLRLMTAAFAGCDGEEIHGVLSRHPRSLAVVAVAISNSSLRRPTAAADEHLCALSLPPFGRCQFVSEEVEVRVSLMMFSLGGVALLVVDCTLACVRLCV